MYRLIIAILVLCHLAAFPAAALGEEYSSGQLIDLAGEYDRQVLIYSGEVIGDILSVGSHVWLNVSDGSNAIGIWADKGLASAVRTAGSYSVHGDSIRVSGTFFRACPEHGGDMDLHADTVTLIERAYPISHAVPAWKVWLAALLTAAAAGLMAFVLGRIKRKPSFAYRPR